MINKEFLWRCHPEAEKILQSFLVECEKNKMISRLAEELENYTNTRLFDWVDHFVVGNSPEMEKTLEENGFVKEEIKEAYSVFRHPKSQLPGILFRGEGEGVVKGVALIVDSICDFLQVRGLNAPVEGAPFSGFRRSCVSTKEGISLWVVERRGTLSMDPTYPSEGYLEKYFSAMEKWQLRPRILEDEEEALEETIRLGKEISQAVGRDLAAYLFCESERKYWQSRNRAAHIQKNRHDRLGMGWANHDHHTFRSSRRHFSKLVQFFQTLGFHKREKFYAGKEAGWGAQVMENSNAGFVLFLDLDLAPFELEIDIESLPELETLGTVGLWCELHGDSILKAGMHHLAAKFLFEKITEDFSAYGIDMMKPFAYFPYLKQAFTKGSVWEVNPEKIQKLRKEERISKKQADKFLTDGALGSHLENLQRREGYKGFSVDQVSIIIKETDPRNH